MNTLRIFISSPGDVQLERQIARRVIVRLQSEFGAEPALEPYYWEYEPMRLTKDFQDQIPHTSSFDIVVCILWSRLGTPLGPQHCRPDGTPYWSGTQFEFEDAAAGFKNRGIPDILVYRNKTDPPIKPRPKEERERQLAQFDALETFLENWTRDGEILKGALTTYTDLAQFEELLSEHLRKLIKARCPTESQDGKPARPRVNWTAGSPFRGLEPFEFEHAPIYRGRTRAVQDVIGLLRRQYIARQAWTTDPADRKGPPLFVLVSAMSGIGKSSLVRAGVLPLLTAPGVIEGIGLWRRALMKPTGGTGRLLDALASALSAAEALPELVADGTPATRLAGLLRDNPSGAGLLLKGALSQAAAKLQLAEEAQLRQWETEFSAQGRTADADRYRKQRETLKQRDGALALFVDQLEEIFAATDKTAEAEREIFLVALDALARSGRAMVLAALRSDFFVRASETAMLAAMTKEGALYQLEPPTVAELAQIVREPAREAGLTFEENTETGARVDDLLLMATQNDPAALPLLEFTLDQLYERRDPNGRLTHQAYRDLNGVEGALAQRAEEEFAALAPNPQGDFGRVFGALINLREGRGEERPVRRHAAMSELAAQQGTADFVDRFARARLLVLDQEAVGDRSVSVVHEALFSYWDRLKNWIEENRHLLRARTRVEAAARRWDSEGRPRDLLVPDGRLLAEAQDLLGQSDLLSLSAPVALFVEQSVAAQKARRRRRAVALAGLAGGLSVAAVISWYQWQALGRNRIEAKLLEYQEAVRGSQTKFYAHDVPVPEKAKEALAAALSVFRLRDEVKALRGRPPETADEDAMKVYEYSAILRAELGDAEGSLRDLQARKALLQSSPKLEQLDKQGISIRSHDVNPYSMVVLDLQMELFISNSHLKMLLWQNDLLKEALAERPGKQQNTPSGPKPTAPPQVPRQNPRELARSALATYKNYVRLFDYLTREHPRQQDFIWMAFCQQLEADAHETLEERDEASRAWEDRVVTSRRRLDWVRDNPNLEDKEGAEYNAASDLLKAQKDVVGYFLKHENFEYALAAARDELKTVETEPELKDSDSDRFHVRQQVAAALSGLGRNKTASQEIEIGATELLESSRQRLGLRWEQLAARYWQVADARADVGNNAGAVDSARQAIAVLEFQARSPAATVTESSWVSAYGNLSWQQIFARQFADAVATAKKGLTLPLGDEGKAELNTNLAHGLLFQGLVGQARKIYEAWKSTPVGKDENGPKLFAKAVLEDFDRFKHAGLAHPEMAAISASMEAALAAQPKATPTVKTQ